MSHALPPSEVPPLVPARMLNEHAYCPRLAYLEWVQGDLADSVDTLDGRYQHRRVDRQHGALPDAQALAGAPEHEQLHARSVMLSAPVVGLVARIDLVEATRTVVTPSTTNAGRPRMSPRELGSRSGCSFAPSNQSRADHAPRPAPGRARSPKKAPSAISGMHPRR